MSPNEDDLMETISSLPYSYDVNSTVKDAKEGFFGGKAVALSIAGRITAIRKSGKVIFMDVMDSTGKMQCFFDFKTLGDGCFQKLKAMNAGDIIGVKGDAFKTNAGEVSINVAYFALLSKAVRVLPNTWYGLKDVELRYRKRYLDLIINPDVRDIFVKRSRIVSVIREYLDDEGFMEFETPTIQPLYGGAEAEPFKVFVNALGEEDYLRISNELYLKRLIIGGFEKVYEIYRAFRNEDIDTTHSPEFTMIEWYCAYADYETMMGMTETLLEKISWRLYNSDSVASHAGGISFKPPFKRIKYTESINSKLGSDILSMDDESLFSEVEKRGITLEPGKRNRAHAYDKLFSLLVQPELIQPTFVIDFPKETSALTRGKRGDSRLVERFELYISGIEIANSYSELNNPIIQRRNFEEQMERFEEGDKEAEPLDMDFVEAMEYGMPPTGGIGIGIDRLVMVFTGQSSIKEVILFPMKRREG
jgi:lysyl-tRNA synthetase class 2